MNEAEMLEMFRRAAVANGPRNSACIAEAVIWLASEVRALRMALSPPALQAEVEEETDDERAWQQQDDEPPY